MKKIFKRGIMAVTALAVMLTAVVFDMPAKTVAEAALSTSAEGGCDKDHSGMTEWTDTTSLPTSGSYYLGANVAVSSETTITDNLTLCLNGQTIDAQQQSRIFNIDGGTLTLCDCQGGGKLTGGNVSGNGGAVYILNGSFTMHGGTIEKNTSQGDSNLGGGVYVDSSGEFTMTGGTISDNTAGVGGGVHVYKGTFTMTDGTISDNKATGSGGGGVYVKGSSATSFGTFTMNGGTIEKNTADGNSSKGGGVYVSTGGIFTMSGDSKISGNKTNTSGGGVYNYDGKFEMTGGTISGNEAGLGGGVYSINSIFNMNGGTISDNTAVYGGGLFVDGKKSTMNDGTISNNTAASNGGGVFIKVGVFEMSGGEISGNTASTYNGGGVYVDSSGENKGTFTMTGGTISGNTTARNGGGVYNNGTFTINGKVDISGNTKDNSDNNVCLNNNKTITIGNNFATDEPIGVNTVTKPTCKALVAVTDETSDISSSFTADIDGQSIVYEGGKVQLKGAHDWSGNWVDGKLACKNGCGAEQVKCGENAGYTYDEETKTLTITGTGDMYDYDDQAPAPWAEDADDIEKVVIGEGITSVGGSTFKGCTSLTDVDIPDTVTSIGEGAFEDCTSLEEVEIPDSVASIGDNAFKGCTSLTEVTIPDSVATIGEGAFEGCTSLEEVEIPDSVTSIGDNAFKGCISLEEVEFKGTTPPTMGDNVFDGADNLDKITVPEGSENAYKEADGFDGVADNITGGTETPDTPVTPVDPVTPAPSVPGNPSGTGTVTNGNTGNSGDNKGDNGNNGGDKAEVQLGGNVPKTELATPTEELISAVLTPEEQEQIKNGGEVKFVLQVDDTVPDEDRRIAESALEADELKAAQYMNITLYKVVDGSKTQVTATNKPIRLTFDVPEALRSPARTFAVMRVHDGKTTVLPDLDSNANTVTIETDSFSTYVLVYRDSASAADNANPATGIAISLVPLAAAIIAVTVTIKRKRK